MPVFNFQSDWRNVKYEPVPGPYFPAAQNGSGGGGGIGAGTVNNEDSPVFSGYFWLYLAISMGFTLITVEIWWQFVVRAAGYRKQRPYYQPPHWTLYLVWPLRPFLEQFR